MDDAAPPDEPARSGGFLQRLFPPAPRLPNRPDPLAGFRYRGPLRPVVELFYLLARNPLAWILPGLLWTAVRMVDPLSALGLVASLVSFALLIGAGWFGWQRPSLFGTAAAILGYVGFVGVFFFYFSSRGAPPSAFGEPGEVLTSLLLSAALQAGLGFVSGWYGGYLRRRQADVRAQVARGRR